MATKTQEVEQQEATKDTSEELLNEGDELLDEIDRLLEESTVVANYRQKGGQ